MKKISKKELKELNLFHIRCLNLVRRKPPEFFVFKKLGCFGWCDYELDMVALDHRKSPIRTAYHECLHYLYPEWSETKVLRVESRMINNLSMLEITNFLKYLAIKLYKGELAKKFLKSKTKKKLKSKNKSVVSNS